MNRLFMFLLLLALPLRAAAGPEPTVVFVSVLPQKFLVERIAGERAEVHVMVGPGKSPATYEPTPRQMTKLADARLYFSVGVPFERVWLPKIASAGTGMQIRPLGRASDEAEDEAGTDGGDGHGHGEEDPHIWTNPLAAVDMARSIAETLAGADPGGADGYRMRLSELEVELRALDRDIRRIMAPLAGRAFYVFHPSWGAFAETYGLEQVAIEQGGGEPGARYLAGIIDRARRDGITVIFTQPQFDSRNAATVARALGGRVAVIDPLAENYIDGLRKAAAAIAEALR